MASMAPYLEKPANEHVPHHADAPPDFDELLGEIDENKEPVSRDG